MQAVSHSQLIKRTATVLSSQRTQDQVFLFGKHAEGTGSETQTEGDRLFSHVLCLSSSSTSAWSRVAHSLF